jgi:hypothetical protein
MGFVWGLFFLSNEMKRSSPALSKKSAFFWGESDFWRK